MEVAETESIKQGNDKIESSAAPIDKVSEEENPQKLALETQTSEENLSQVDIFNPDVKIVYDSDEEVETNTKNAAEVDSAISSSDSDSDSDSDISSDSDNDSSEDEKSRMEGIDDDETNDGGNEGPILSKNEVTEESVDTLPADFKIEPETVINYVGFITGIVEKSIIIKATISAEEKVLDSGTVFCLEDRTPLGYLYEVFGRLQSPVYRVKFNSDEELEPFKEMKGHKVFYIQPSAHFLWTKQIKQMKGTDASNANDEELPEEEQEFSDDEQEAAAKKAKNKRKSKSNSKPVAEKKQKLQPSTQSNQFTSLPSTTPNKDPKTSSISRTTNGMDNVNKMLTNATPEGMYPQPPVDINAIAVMQNFLQIFQQSNSSRQSQMPQNSASNSQSYNMPSTGNMNQSQAKPNVVPNVVPPPSITHPQQPMQQPMYYSHNPNMYNYQQQYMPHMQHPQQYNPYYGYQAPPPPQYQMPSYTQQMYQQYPATRSTYPQQNPPPIVPHASQNQHHQHQNPNQTNPASILAQLSGNSSSNPKEAGENSNSRNDEYDPSNP